MKSAITLACLLLVSGHTSAQESGQDIIRALGNGRMASDEGDKRFQRLPPDEKAEFLSLMIQQAQAYGRGEDLSKQEKFPVTRPHGFVMIAAHFLYEHATDAQKISAFGNLAGFGKKEYEAAEVLASCKSNAGLKSSTPSHGSGSMHSLRL